MVKRFENNIFKNLLGLGVVIIFLFVTYLIISNIYSANSFLTFSKEKENNDYNRSRKDIYLEDNTTTNHSFNSSFNFSFNSKNQSSENEILNQEFSLEDDLRPLDQRNVELQNYVSSELLNSNLDKENLPILCIKDACFYTEISNTLSSRQKGLGLRDNISNDSGMLFVFEKPGSLSFWMKGMLFSIDIIWVNEKSEIVHIEKNLPLCNLTCPSYNPLKNDSFNSKYVFEINAGLSNFYNFSIGDKLRIKI